MAGDLPRYIALRFRPNMLVDRIMRVPINDSAGGGLFFDMGATVIKGAPTSTKFELEPAKAGNGRFRHIRSCYNNKYLTRRSHVDMMITASADQPEEDQSNHSCTLFELPRNSGTVQLRHVATGSTAFVNLSAGSVLALPRPGDTQSSQFSIIDWGSIVIFPDYVVIKGDNGMHLRTTTAGTSVQFINEDDIANKSLMYRADYARDGGVMLYSISAASTLRRLPSNIAKNNRVVARYVIDYLALASDLTFQATKVQGGPNKVILKNVGSNRFCTRTSNNFLHADSATANLSSSILEVNEAVFSRSIYNVRYRLMEARIYDEAPVLITSSSNNNTSNIVPKVLRFYRRVEESTSWDHSVSVESGVKTTFRTGIPFLVRGKVTVSVNAGYERTWGKTVTTTKEIDISHTVIVPPRTKVEVTLVVTKGVCDIPFSYTRRDTLSDGRKRITVHHDGLFTGVSHYNFKYNTVNLSQG